MSLSSILIIWLLILFQEFQHNIKGTTNPSYLEEIKQLYIRDEFSRQVQEWNKIRGEAIEECIQKILYPAFTLELQTLLVKEAHEFISRVSFFLYFYIFLASVVKETLSNNLITELNSVPVLPSRNQSQSYS